MQKPAFQRVFFEAVGGAKRDRTADLYNAIVALSQLSYSPVTCDLLINDPTDRATGHARANHCLSHRAPAGQEKNGS